LLGDSLTNRTDCTLLGVLLNPPLSTPGNRTRNAVTRAGRVLGYDGVEILNLFADATRSVVELNAETVGDGWARTRGELSAGLRSATGVLAAWGVSGMAGAARQARDEQVAWLMAEAVQAGVSSFWMVGGEPRHPSRWHQFLSDKYGRTTGGSFEERLVQSLVAMPVSCPESNNHRGVPRSSRAR
jgi:hypothetical protein